MRFYKPNTDGTINNAVIITTHKHFVVHLTERQKDGELVKIKMVTSKPMKIEELGKVTDNFLKIGFKKTGK